MNLEKPNENRREIIGATSEKTESDSESTMLIQEQEPWKPFDKNIGEDNKRLPASPEQIEKMDQTVKELGSLFDGFDRWHLDGALNISLLKKEYIGNHKDVDLSVERNDLKDLEKFLEKKGYGLFLSQNEKDGDNRKKIMRRVSHIGTGNYEGHPMICAISENGKIDKSKNLNYVDLHVVDRDENNLPVLESGVNCPEEWTKAYPTIKDGQKINLSHPAKVFYYKLNQGRNYDPTDVDRLLELDAVKVDDIDEIKSIFEQEFIKKKESIFSLCEEITQKITSDMDGEQIFGKIKEIEEFKDKDLLNDSLKHFSSEVFKLQDKSPGNLFNLAINLFGVDKKNQDKLIGLERMKQEIDDRRKLNQVRMELNK